MQDLISGRKISTVLSFAAPREDFDRYKPVFEGAAQATRGAYSHGGINWGRAFVSGGVVGGAVALGYLVLGLVRRRRDSSEWEGAPEPAPLRRASKYTWVCPACKNLVPTALDKCRCGAPRPA